jgi:hypothetical protein
MDPEQIVNARHLGRTRPDADRFPTTNNSKNTTTNNSENDSPVGGFKSLKTAYAR